jgi:hypothetical protein
MSKTKSFDITKEMVYRAYKKIKANKGAYVTLKLHHCIN